MIAPLSAKQEREWAKHHAKEDRESRKMEHEESRKQELHEIKLQEAAVKAGQGIAHKEELHGIKVKELGGPLSGKRINREKLGLPSQNPMAGTEMFQRGQHMLPKGSTDTVPAMLTPGEAVIPRAAAQDPKNKPAIARMVAEGRGYARGTTSVGTGIVQQQNMIPILPKVAPHRKVKGYEDGTTQVPDHYATGSEEIPNPNNYYHTDNVATMSQGSINIKPSHEGLFTAKAKAAGMGVQEYASKVLAAPEGHYDPATRKQANFAHNANKWEDGVTDTSIGLRMSDMNRGDQTGIAPYGLRYMESATDPVVPKGSGYVGDIPAPDNSNATEMSSSDEKGQYPNIVPTLSKEEANTVANLPEGQDIPQNITNKAQLYRDSRTAQGESAFADNVGLKAPVGAGDSLYKEGQPKPVSISEVSATPPVIKATPYDTEDARKAEPSIPDAKAVVPPAPVNEKTQPEYWIKHLQGVQADLDKAAAGSKDQQGFVDSFKDIFSYKGLKDALGLNNQEVARMAVTYLGGRARGYDGARSLSYAGRAAFDSSLQRQNREATEKGANMRLGVQMAAQERRDERLDAEVKRKELAAEKKEYAALAKEKRKELENDQDRFENFSSKDVPMGIRQKALDIAYAPLKSSTPEERLEERRQNMRQATTLLASNVLYKDPNSGRHDRVPKWGYYEDAKGNTVYAAQDPYGSGDMIVRHPNGKTEKMGGQLLRPEGTTAKQGEFVAKVTKNYLEGAKGADGKPIDTSAVGAKIMTVMQDFPGIGDNPFAVNAAIEPTVKALAESGKDYSATAVRAAFTGNMVKTLTPTQTDLFVAQGSKPGSVKPVSGSSLVEFGKAMQDAQSAGKVDLTKATETYVDIWNNKLSTAEKQKIANTTRDGYSPFQEFVIRDVKKQK